MWPPLLSLQPMHLSRVYRQSLRCFHTSTSVKALSALAQPVAERISTNWKGTNATGSPTKNFVGGQFVESKATEWIDVHDPVSHRIYNSFIYLPVFNAFSFSQLKRSSHGFPKRLTRNFKRLSIPLPRLSKHGVEQVSLPARDLFSSTFIPNHQPALLMMLKVATSIASERRRYCQQHRAGTRKNFSRYVISTPKFVLHLTFFQMLMVICSEVCKLSRRLLPFQLLF
jgi:hypothetical protein